MIEADRGGRIMTRLRVVQPPETTDILSREEEVAQFKASLAAMAVAELFINQEGESEFSVNEEFFSVFGKASALLPPREGPGIVYACNYEEAREEALKEFVLTGSDIIKRTGNPTDIMLKIWMEENIPDGFLLLEKASKRYVDPYLMIDLRVHRSKILEVSHAKFVSLHPELREGMMTEEEWQRQEERKKEERFRAAAPQKPKEIEQAEASASKPAEKDPEEIPKLDTELAEHLTWKVKVFLADKQASSEQFKTARLNALAAGLPVFSTDADKVAALINEDFVIDFKPNLALGQFRALKLNAGVMLEEEKKKAKKAKKAEASVIEKGAGKD